MGHGFEKAFGMDEAHGVSGADGGVAQGLGQEALPDTRRPHQENMFVLVQELQGEDSVQEPAVQGDGGGPVEVLQAAGLLEAGALKPQFHAAVGAAIDLVTEDDLQEGGIVQLFPAGQCDALGQGVINDNEECRRIASPENVPEILAFISNPNQD